MVVVLTALFAGPHFVDWNSYRGVFEEEASRVLGRDVRVGGAVNLRLLPKPYVSLEKLKISDPDSETGDSLLRAENFTLWLSVPPLLKGVLEANKIEIRRPVVQLVSGKDGKGNWQNVTFNAGHIPFVPDDVTLQSVNIIDGTVIVGTSKRSEIARFDAINGELSADAVEGPYKFAGTVTASGVSKEVRVATAAPDENGVVRYKASVKPDGNGNGYALAGTISGIKDQLKYDGELSANLIVPALGSGQPAKPLKSDLTAKVSGDTHGFELKEMALAFDAQTSPQTVTGSAKVSWPDRTEITAELNSRLFDIDRLTGGGKVVPMTFARDLAEAMAAELFGDAATEATVAFDQVTLGGETLSGVHLKASRKGGPLQLSDVKASLPGGTRADISGVLDGTGDKRSFIGQVSVRGQSLLKFLNWGTGAASPLPAKADGPFMLEGGLGLSADSIDVSEATAEVAGIPLSGEIKVGRGTNSKVSISVDGDRIDAGLFMPGILDPGFLAAQLRGRPVKDGPAPVFPKDVRIRLRAGELIDGDHLYRNVDANLAAENGRLSVPRLKVTTSDGVTLDLEGETASASTLASVDDVGKTANAMLGIIRGTVTAKSPVAVAALARSIGLRTVAAASDPGIQQLAPLSLAGTLAFGGQTESAMSVTFDGSAGAARLAGKVQLDGGLGTPWTDASAGLTLTADSQDIVSTSAALMALRKGSPVRFAIDPKPGHLSVVARSGGGGPVLVRATVAASGLTADIDGKLLSPQTDAQEFAGDVRLKTDDARQALALAGLHVGKGIGVVPLEGILLLSAKESGWSVASKSLMAGESRLAGTLSAGASDTGSTKYAADIDVQSATIPGLLAFLTTDTIAPAAVKAVDLNAKPVRENKWRRTVSQADPLPSIWPLQSFDSAAVGSVPGTIKARFATLAFEPGVSLREVELEAVVAPGIIDVTRLDGAALSGEIHAKIKLEKSGLGMSLTGSTGYSSGKNTATISFTGSGAAPADVVRSLTGKGELALHEVTLTGNSPAAVGAVAENFIAGNVRNAAGQDVEDQLIEAIKTGSLALGQMTIPLAIEGGTARLSTVKIDTADGRAANDTSLELQSLKLDSQWRIEPKVQRSLSNPERIVLAPVTVAYSGKLKDLATLEPVIVTTALERELTVRKMERGVEELERLRQIDETKAKEEKDRRIAEEVQRLKDLEAKRASIEAAKAAAAAGLTPPGPAAAVNPAANLGADSMTGSADPAALSKEQEGDVLNGATAPVPRSDLGRSQPANSPKPLRKKSQRETWKPFSVSPYQ